MKRIVMGVECVHSLFLPTAGIQSSASLKAHIRLGPVKENEEAVPEADPKKDEDEDSDVPGYKAGRHKPLKLTTAATGPCGC
jgi:hypothetical protein